MIEPIAEPAIVDPICGRTVDPLRARAVGIFGGQTRYFCSAECKAAYAGNSGPHVLAPAAPVAPKPAPVLLDVPMIAPREPVVDAPAPVAPRPRSRAGLFMIIGIVTAAVVLAYLLRQKPPAPIASVPFVSSPVVVAPKPAPPSVAAHEPAPVVAAEAVPAYEGSLKLGMRRFADASVRLLLIDEAGTPTILTVASNAAGATEGAIEPEADFARARREPGVVFKDAGVEVERRPTELVVRGPAGEKVVAHLAADTALRAAPFARARYDSK